MLEEAYHIEATAALTLLGRLWFDKIAYQLWNYAESLNDWLYHLSKHPSPDWRERFEAFVAEQEAAGFILSPESRADLVAYLEGWAGGFRPAEDKPTPPVVVQPEFQTVSHGPVARNATGMRAAPHSAQLRSHTLVRTAPANTLVAHRKPRPSPYGDAPANSHQGQFNRWLRVADGYLDDIEKLLDPLGKKVADAKSDEAVEVETDVDEIASFIGAHNDAMENARQQWLEGDLGREAFDYLMLARTPASLWLPLFVNPQQAKRAQEQWKKIGVRLKERIAFLDNVIFAMEVTEHVGEAASLAIGAGIVVNAVKTGGKIALVKLVAQAALADGVARATDAASQAVEDALLAAGVSQETINTIQTGATVVAFVLELKRMGTSLRSAPVPKPPTPLAVPKGSTTKLSSTSLAVSNTASATSPKISLPLAGSTDPKRGKKRGPSTDPNAPHNAAIRAQAKLLEAAGNTILAGGGQKPERKIKTPGGSKDGRRPDILFETPNGERRGRNVGRTDSKGDPVKRELEALADLNGPGRLPTDFIPYD